MDVTFFSEVREGLDAQYNSGNKTKPSSLEELDNAFLSAAQEMAAGALESQKEKDQGLVMEREFTFDWQALGDEGISACPELVEEIRTYLNSYDFNLMFMR